MKVIKIILTLVTALVVGKSFAQSLEFQVLMRPALTSIRGNDVIERFDPAIHISAGLGANYFVSDKALINVAVLYDRKGNKTEVDLRNEQNQPLGSAKVRSNFDYLTIPVQWGPRFGKKVKYQFGIGAYAAFLIKQEEVSKGPLEDVKIDRTGNFKRTDFGLSASFTILIPVNESLFINLGLSDHLGLTNVSDVPTANDGTIKHNSLGIMTGVNFKIK